MFESLLNKLKAMLDNLDSVQECYGYEAGTFRGDPAITITPSANESEYISTSSNERVYAFTVRCWVSRTEGEDATTEKTTLDLVDDVLDLFDKYYTLSSSSPDGETLNVPTGYCLTHVEAAPSAWFYVDRGDGFRMAEITIRVHVQVDVTLIANP